MMTTAFSILEGFKKSNVQRKGKRKSLVAFRSTCASKEDVGDEQNWCLMEQSQEDWSARSHSSGRAASLRPDGGENRCMCVSVDSMEEKTSIEPPPFPSPPSHTPMDTHTNTHRLHVVPPIQLHNDQPRLDIAGDSLRWM